MAVSQQALTSATQAFQHGFMLIQHDFLGYGQAIFFALLTIAVVLGGLEHARSGDISSSLPQWMHEILIAMFFYTVMQNLDWLASLPNSANKIGLGYLGSIDPSSIIMQGINIENKIMQPLLKAGLFESGASMLVGMISAVVVAYCMINIAINVAVTLIVTQGLISTSPLFLSAGAFKVSRQVARNLIDAIIGNTVKLIGYYLVIYIGNTAIATMISQIDGTFNPDVASIDQYGFIIAITALYFALAKTLPDQLAKLVSGVVQENRGTEIGAAVTAMQRVATSVAPLSATLKSATLGSTGIVSATARNALANYRQNTSGGAGVIKAATKSGATGLGNLAKSSAGVIADKFRAASSGGVTNRMAQATRTAQAQTQANLAKTPPSK